MYQSIFILQVDDMLVDNRNG